MVRVGVLSLHTSKETKAICNAVEELGHDPEWLRAANTTVAVEDGRATLSPAVDVVCNRLLLSNTTQPCEGLGLAATVDGLVPTLNPPAAVLRAVHKFATATTLAAADVPVPDALLALSSDRLNRERERFGDEAVYKSAIGTHGGGTWRVGPDDTVSATVGDRYAFLQSMVAGEGRHRDVRVYVVDGEAVGAMFRYAPEDDWRTNVALGGDVEDATGKLPDAVERTAVRATEALGLDFAGVDLVEGADGWYVLEANPTAGFKGLYRATGRSPAPHLARQAIEAAGGDVDDDRVADLTSTLDDSTPSCAPAPATTERERRTVGFTESVVVTGTSGSTRAVAKSDTGATRTSVDTSLAAEVGAGPIRRSTRVKSGSRKQAKSRPLVDLVVGVAGEQHTVTASVEDRSHMDYPLLLGRDILEHYTVDVGRRHDGPVDAEE
jgi:RimK family alpha-L-glutamate ligase